MKKLFFFKSSGSSNGNNKASLSPPSTDKPNYWENPSESGLDGQVGNNFRGSKGLFSKSRKQISDIHNSSKCPSLRRSRSLSSAAFLGIEPGQIDYPSLRDQSRSPSSITSSANHQHSDHPFRCHALTLERHTSRHYGAPERPDSAGSSRTRHNSSGSSSSTCSSNVSSKILDRYIDGEHQQAKNRPDGNSSQMNNGSLCGWHPPRVQYTSPSSPTDSVKDKARAHSFRDAQSLRLRFSSRDWVENGFGHESPRSLAKNVIERLSQTCAHQNTSQKELDCEMPVTVEDIYGRSMNSCFRTNSDTAAQRSYSMDEPYDIFDKYNKEHYPSSGKQFYGDYSDCLNSKEPEEDVDVELQRRAKEAEDRVMVLSEELEQESFLQDSGLNVPALIQTVRNLNEEKVNLALEISNLLQSQIADRASAKEEFGVAKAELESQIRRLEKEKIELQSGLERELDRRSSDWSIKLEKYQKEEQRLRERVRELAEHNVSLQREVSSFNERETKNRSMITYYEQQLKDLTAKVQSLGDENTGLLNNLSELQELYRVAEENFVCFKKNFEEKEKECKEMHKSITRLVRTCGEQQKTIDGMRESYSEELGKNDSQEKIDKHLAKLQMEQMRLIGVELALRRELESYRLEVDSLRHENINLLNRLKGDGKESEALNIKLDKEMWTRVCCLQNHGLSLLNESSELCSKLLEFVKGRASQLSETNQETEVSNHGLDGFFLVESEMRVQGLKHGVKSLIRSLQTMSSLLHDKSILAASKYQSKYADAERSAEPNYQTPEDLMRYELKAETLLTSLLREKLYSKEQEVEQLQAELATAVRGNDIIRYELQNVMDSVSCVNHKLKDCELQILKKDESINRLQSDLQESTKDLTVVRGILPKISEERDLMWKEVKQYNEKNMLLNSEVSLLKKKIEALDEELLIKEGQITILKDTIGNRPFDLLGSHDSSREFLLQ